MHAWDGWIRAGVLLGLVSACATRDGVRLVHPPASADPSFPGGHRLLVDAPLGDWTVAARFADRDACEQARRAATETAAERARARAGDAAKYDLDLRRAVNARCVPIASPDDRER